MQLFKTIVPILYLVVFFLSLTQTAYPSTDRITKDSINIENLSKIADSLINIGDYEKAITYFKQASCEAKKIKNWSKYLYCFSGIHYALFVLGRKDEYIKYFPQIEPYIHIKDESVIWAYYKPIASLYRKQGNYKKALKYSLKALEKSNNIIISDSINIPFLYTNVAFNLQQIKEYRKAIQYYQLSLNTLSKMKRVSFDIAQINNNIAYIYEEKHMYDKALYHYLKSLNIVDTVTTKSSDLSDLEIIIQFN